MIETIQTGTDQIVTLDRRGFSSLPIRWNPAVQAPFGLRELRQYALTLQREMIAEIETAQPDFIVFVNIAWSWLGRPNSHPVIFDRFEKYGPCHYQTVELVDIQSLENTVYRWDEKGGRSDSQIEQLYPDI